MTYKRLIQILDDDCNCDCIRISVNNPIGFLSWVIENSSNGLSFPLAGHPDWEVDEIILANLKERLRLNPHPFLN